MKDWQGTTRFEYDQLDRINRVIDHNGKEVSYGYDGVGNQVEIVYPNAEKVEYQYNFENQVTKIIEGGNITTYTYDTFGNELKQIKIFRRTRNIWTTRA